MLVLNFIEYSLYDGVIVLCLLPDGRGSSGHYIGNDIVQLKIWSKNGTISCNNATQTNTLLVSLNNLHHPYFLRMV
jgi:hypothetical protein